jgi:hypothetical protein
MTDTADTAVTATTTATLRRKTGGSIYKSLGKADLHIPGYWSRLDLDSSADGKTIMKFTHSKDPDFPGPSKLAGLEMDPSEYELFTGVPDVKPTKKQMLAWEIESAVYEGGIATITRTHNDSDNKAQVLDRGDRIMEWTFKRATAEAPSANTEDYEPTT